MGYYDPPDYRDWEADAWCGVCEVDTVHLFAHQVGATMTHATCLVCESEFSLHPSDFED